MSSRNAFARRFPLTGAVLLLRLHALEIGTTSRYKIHCMLLRRRLPRIPHTCILQAGIRHSSSVLAMVLRLHLFLLLLLLFLIIRWMPGPSRYCWSVIAWQQVSKFSRIVRLAS